MIIQKAELKDAKRLLEVQKIAFEKYALKYGDFDNNPYHMELDRMEFNIRYRFGQYFKVVENEQIIGGIFGFELDDPKIIKIAQFYLLPEFQALGYGTEILEYFIENNIYVKESIVALLEIFKSIERVAVLIDADKKFDLHSNFNIGNFKDLCAKIDLYDRANIPNTLNLLEYLSYVYSRNILNYIYSVLAVIEVKDRSDSRDIYEYITHNIGSVSSDEYVYKIFDDPITFNGLDKYKKFRGKILELSKNI